MKTDTKGSRTIFVPGDLNSAAVRGMTPDELFDLGIGHIDEARHGDVENPTTQLRWGMALLTRGLGMLGVAPGEVKY